MYHIIINPASRSWKGLQIWKKQIEPALQSKNVTYRSYFSEKTGDVARLAKQITSSPGTRPLTLIILGGDGTVNEALQGIQDTSEIILGYIPTGSSNDLARDLKLPKVPLAALELILQKGKPTFMDLATLTYDDGSLRRFAVSCGIGFDAAVCEEALHSKIKLVLNKLGLGKLTYLGIALKQLFAAKAVSCKLSLDNKPPIDIKTVLFVTAMLHRYEGGGFMFCPDADSGDGLLNICAVGDIPKLLVLLALPTAFWGKHYIVKGITPYTASRIHIETSKPLWVHTDGEVTRKSRSFTVSCQAKAIRIILP